MKNIKPYSGDCFSFHENVIKSKYNTKSDPDYKNRVELLNPTIKTKIEEYSDMFNTDSLQNIIAVGFNSFNKADLQNLYDYGSKKLQQLKVELTTDKNNRVNNTCQNCTVGEINSFDHYLPQTEFSEFIVNPINLIPSCSKCNSHKSSVWRDNGKRKFLNLYLDKLPDIQYLFVGISVVDNEIDLDYYLDSKNGVDEKLFELLKYHYKKLKLFERFKNNSDTIISELDTEILKYSKRLPIDVIKETIIEECQDNYKLLGRNNWKLVLKVALINDTEYLDRFYNTTANAQS